MTTNFIEQYKTPLKLCDDLINYFNKNIEHTRPGEAGRRIDPLIKESTDLSCAFQNIYPVNHYMEHINKLILKYQDKYTELKDHARYACYKGFQIQHYKPKGGFKRWHNERMGTIEGDRLLVFMTYLNTVPGGGTHFKYQKKTIKAKKGVTIIWPTDFTHTHKGEISKTKEKYIATGWIHFT